MLLESFFQFSETSEGLVILAFSTVMNFMCSYFMCWRMFDQKFVSTWELLFTYLKLLDFVDRDVETNSLRNRNKTNMRNLNRNREYSKCNEENKKI